MKEGIPLVHWCSDFPSPDDERSRFSPIGREGRTMLGLLAGAFDLSFVCIFGFVVFLWIALLCFYYCFLRE